MRGIVETAARLTISDRIRAEAERRIDAGITVNGKTFRCDGETVQRLDEMVQAFAEDAVGPAGIRFRTRAGQSVTLSDQDEAQTVYAAVRAYRLACLGCSDALQDAGSDDYRSDAVWPDPPAISI